MNFTRFDCPDGSLICGLDTSGGGAGPGVSSTFASFFPNSPFIVKNLLAQFTTADLLIWKIFDKNETGYGVQEAQHDNIIDIGI